jgi:hypothetical protein
VGAALVLVAPSSVAEASASAADLPPIMPTELSGPGRLISDILRYAPNLPLVAAPGTAPSATIPAVPSR